VNKGVVIMDVKDWALIVLFIALVAATFSSFVLNNELNALKSNAAGFDWFEVGLQQTALKSLQDCKKIEILSENNRAKIIGCLK
jgi:hypothetical protein